jgi:hypothetical protein
MPRKSAKVTQSEISRALRAVAASGLSLAVEVMPDGTIRLIPCDKIAKSLIVNKINLANDEWPVL